MLEWLNTLLQGVLLGGLYALFATGLALSFGVMRLVNIAHGDLIVLAAFLGLAATEVLPLHPLASLVLVAPLMFAIGYGVQRWLINPALGAGILPPLIVTFGLSIVIQNGLLQLFTADSRKLTAGAIETGSLPLAAGLSVGWFPLLMFLTAVAVIAGLQLLLYRTAVGRVFRAISDDAETARLYGVDDRHAWALAAGLAGAIVAVAGVFLGIQSNFDPSIGPARLLYAFEAVVIGGLGSLWGTLAGGVILGVAQLIGGKLDPGWQILAGHLAFLAVLVLKPRGLFPRAVD